MNTFLERNIWRIWAVIGISIIAAIVAIMVIGKHLHVETHYINGQTVQCISWDAAISCTYRDMDEQNPDVFINQR